MSEEEKQEIINVTTKLLEDKIYIIRGQKVMFDFDLAKIYGYSTKRFNEQVKNNIRKFPENFCFRIHKYEYEDILISKKSISKNQIYSRGGRIRAPIAFTEEGIYMLMTVLRGDLAVKQSIALITAFKQMKDYLFRDKQLLTSKDLELLISDHDTRIKLLENRVGEFIDRFTNDEIEDHIVFKDGERIESDVAYRSIYKTATKSILIVDDYIGIKTLELLKVVTKNVSIIIVSDNLARDGISKEFLDDFIKDTGINIKMMPSNQRFHDRYICVDFGSDNESIYHCGTSSKDSGSKITSISRIMDTKLYYPILSKYVN